MALGLESASSRLGGGTDCRLVRAMVICFTLLVDDEIGSREDSKRQERKVMRSKPDRQPDHKYWRDKMVRNGNESPSWPAEEGASGRRVHLLFVPSSPASVLSHLETVEQQAAPSQIPNTSNPDFILSDNTTLATSIVTPDNSCVLNLFPAPSLSCCCFTRSGGDRKGDQTQS